MSEPAKPRVALAVIGALPILAVVVGLAIYNRAARSQLAIIRACRHCGNAGKQVDEGWVVVQPGDAWSVALGPHAGLVLRGPARFEVAGKQRVALSSGAVFLAASSGERAVVLLPRSETAGIEGASAATAGPGARVAATAGADGNRVDVLAGAATLAVGSGDRALKQGETWQTGKPPDATQPQPDERAWLDALAGP